MHVCACVCMCVHVCACVCMCVHDIVCMCVCGGGVCVCLEEPHQLGQAVVGLGVRQSGEVNSQGLAARDGERPGKAGRRVGDRRHLCIYPNPDGVICRCTPAPTWECRGTWVPHAVATC